MYTIKSKYSYKHPKNPSNSWGVQTKEWSVKAALDTYNVGQRYSESWHWPCDVGNPRVFGQGSWCATSRMALTFWGKASISWQWGWGAEDERDKDKEAAWEEEERRGEHMRREWCGWSWAWTCWCRPIQGAKSHVHQHIQGMDSRIKSGLQLRKHGCVACFCLFPRLAHVPALQ